MEKGGRTERAARAPTGRGVPPPIVTQRRVCRGAPDRITYRPGYGWAGTHRRRRDARPVPCRRPWSVPRQRTPSQFHRSRPPIELGGLRALRQSRDRPRPPRRRPRGQSGRVVLRTRRETSRSRGALMRAGSAWGREESSRSGPVRSYASPTSAGKIRSRPQRPEPESQATSPLSTVVDWVFGRAGGVTGTARMLRFSDSCALPRRSRKDFLRGVLM